MATYASIWAANETTDALIESVKNVGLGSAIEDPAGGVPRQNVAKGAQPAVRTIAEQEVVLGMGTRQTEEDFARVHSHAGQIATQAVGGVEGDVHFLQ